MFLTQTFLYPCTFYLFVFLWNYPLLKHLFGKSQQRVFTLCYTPIKQLRVSHDCIKHLHQISSKYFCWIIPLQSCNPPVLQRHSASSCVDRPHLEPTPGAALCNQQVPLDGACMLSKREPSAAHCIFDLRFIFLEKANNLAILEHLQMIALQSRSNNNKNKNLTIEYLNIVF